MHREGNKLSLFLLSAVHCPVCRLDNEQLPKVALMTAID
jgi:hypothetical protein